jgi:hypothetical protein
MKKKDKLKSQVHEIHKTDKGSNSLEMDDWPILTIF